MIERDLVGEVRLVRAWGRIGTQGSERVHLFATEKEAAEALEVLARPGEQSSPLLQGWVQTDHRVRLTTLRLSAPFDIKNRARVEP